ncbi:MAG: VWA domain-containing protein [Acidobacteriota bacterium]
MSFTVTSVWPLLLLLLVIPILWVERGVDRRTPGRRALLATRLATLLLLVLALLQPVLTTPTRDLATAFILDVSGSMAPQSLDEGIEWISEAAASMPGDTVVLAAAGEVRRVDRAEDIRTLEVSDGPSESALDRSASHLENALTQAHGLLPEGRRRQIVLLTDGNETAGHAERGAELLAERSTPIHTHSLSARSVAPWIRDATVDGAGRLLSAGAPFRLDVELVASRAGEHRVTVAVDGRAQFEEALGLSAGANRIGIELRLPEPGLHRVTLALDDGDPSYALDLRARAKESALIVDTDGASAGFAAALERQGFETRLVDPATLSRTDLDDYTSVVLSDVPAEALPQRLQTRLARWVETGGNLLLAGGPLVFGEEGYSGGSLEAMLPIEFNVEEERREVSLMIALDKSYSMKGEKMELAKEATKAALDVLEDEHRFGVVTFDWNPFDAVPLAEASARDEMTEAIRRIEASAQTNFYPALESCLRQLSAVESKVKHIILVSDGKTYPDDYESLLQRIRAEEITVSTVAVGLEADVELLRSIAEWGDGNSYFIQDASRVQKILIDEARGTVEDTVVEGEHRAKVVRSASFFGDLDVDAAPPLRGVMTTKARESSVTVLETADDVPLLSLRNVGLGRSTVFTSDLKNRWAASWLSWPGFGPLFAQVLRSGHDRSPGSRHQLHLTPEGDELIVAADLLGAAGQRLSAARPQARVTSPSGEEFDLPLRLVAPGAYRNRLRLPEGPGLYRVDLFDGGRLEASTSYYRPLRSELRALPQRTDLLERIAEATGGTTEPTIEDLTAGLGEGQPRQTPLWRGLALSGLLLYLLDLFLRRFGLFNRLAARSTGATDGTGSLRAA